MNDLPDAHARAEDAEREVRRLAEEVGRLKALLRDLEWISPYGRCPTCLAMRDIGHDDDCRLKAAIG